jgi:hypothetical protein
MRTAIIIAASTLLASCVSSDQMQQIFNSQAPPTSDERAAAIRYIKDTFYDPYSIRDASISNVVTLEDTGIRAACVRFNAKNRMGGYVGKTATSLRFRGSMVISALQDAPSCMDQRLRYQNFPELENL